MKTANATVIELKEVVKDIKGKRIIDHVTLHLESGKITGLKGVNGSGKTMLTHKFQICFSTLYLIY